MRYVIVICAITFFLIWDGLYHQGQYLHTAVRVMSRVVRYITGMASVPVSEIRRLDIKAVRTVFLRDRSESGFITSFPPTSPSGVWRDIVAG
jgi:hypothetical protein